MAFTQFTPEQYTSFMSWVQQYVMPNDRTRTFDSGEKTEVEYQKVYRSYKSSPPHASKVSIELSEDMVDSAIKEIHTDWTMDLLQQQAVIHFDQLKMGMDYVMKNTFANAINQLIYDKNQLLFTGGNSVSGQQGLIGNGTNETAAANDAGISANTAGDANYGNAKEMINFLLAQVPVRFRDNFPDPWIDVSIGLYEDLRTNLNPMTKTQTELELLIKTFQEASAEKGFKIAGIRPNPFLVYPASAASPNNQVMCLHYDDPRTLSVITSKGLGAISEVPISTGWRYTWVWGGGIAVKEPETVQVITGIESSTAGILLGDLSFSDTPQE